MTNLSPRAAHLLVVDDDERIRKMLTRYFEQEGYRISAAENGPAMQKVLSGEDVDIVLLDITMPGEDGLALARAVRTGSDVGIIMLTGHSDLLDRVLGLEMGADDYITKPFELREVLARVKSLLRRRKPSSASMPTPAEDAKAIQFDGWTLDLDRRQLLMPTGDEIILTTAEFDLLAVFVKNPGRVLSRDRLMDLTRGRSWEAFDRTIDSQIARLRKKVEDDPKNPVLVKSVRGVGYVFTGKVSS